MKDTIIKSNKKISLILKKKLLVGFLLLSLPFFTSSCKPKIEPISKTSFMLNTVVQVTLYDSNDPTLIDDVFALCQEYENLLSKTIETSEVSKLNNRKEGETTHSLSPVLEEILQKGLYYSQISHGGFDITIGGVSNLWDFTSDTFILPTDTEIKKQLPSVGYEKIKIENHEITFLDPNTKIDLGAIAKGYIADKMKEELLSKGVKSAIINLGGNVLCIGNKPDGTPFNIGLAKPFEDRSETVGTLQISDATVVSSGVYERNHFVDGVNYHHLLDPKSGYPIRNQLTAVTIITKNSIDGDGLSTTCFSLGLEEGMNLINSLDDTYGVFITDDGQLHYSEGAESLLSQ